ncbi:MAG TPA: TadE/TadG family type IV pilus assembly protein [Phycisphaerae bacterium]|mgnify:CR=1 FL=1|jgi:Flp pilus assembly protein TadG|nr:pilus assembly protein [Phycisphaerae bacterium]HOB75039.1 TadE/TadG family type IV pilus assembly protein [Phycisphaerae bacterium]HOJ54826.1 TadE/TadG family type IV pilus assembly protein [Phycisphaerae bacterium]HOL26896.1 TadE/TadG family type IV pilus assembly protein [Phycisphaerae bacterium]HPP20851.1 TadE/TadG family type IV pilus assembly protein [Phycisphaerae bacterium]
MTRHGVLHQGRGRARRRTVRRGAAVVEMAVVTPLLLLIMLGVIEFGWVFMTTETLTNATREAARVGVLQGSTHEDIRNRFNAAIAPTGLSVSPSELIITDATPENPVVTVRVAIPYSRISLAGNWLGLNIDRTIGSSCTMRKEGQL